MFPNQTISSSPHSVPQLKDLVLVRAVEWYDLGLQLGVENAELKVIQKNNPGDLRACRREMFEAWLRNYSKSILPAVGGSSAGSGRDQ